MKHLEVDIEKAVEIQEAMDSIDGAIVELEAKRMAHGGGLFDSGDPVDYFEVSIAFETDDRSPSSKEQQEKIQQIQEEGVGIDLENL